MKICEVKGCESSHRACNYKGRFLCQRHQNHFFRYGKILERTRSDKNQIVDKGAFCKMAIYNLKQEVVAYTYFDKGDVEEIRKHKWCVNPAGYARTRINGRVVFLHNLIMQTPKGKIVDHRDHNPSNNRKSNLRICSQLQNTQNVQKRENTSSIFKGVAWNKEKRKWETYINYNRKRLRIGYFDKELWAGMAYDMWAKELHKTFAKTNF